MLSTERHAIYISTERHVINRATRWEMLRKQTVGEEEGRQIGHKQGIPDSRQSQP